MTHLSQAAPTLGGTVTGKLSRRVSASVSATKLKTAEDSYSDIFKSQADEAAEFAKMLASAQQPLNAPFAQEFPR